MIAAAAIAYVACQRYEKEQPATQVCYARYPGNVFGVHGVRCKQQASPQRDPGSLEQNPSQPVNGEAREHVKRHVDGVKRCGGKPAKGISEHVCNGLKRPVIVGKVAGTAEGPEIFPECRSDIREAADAGIANQLQVVVIDESVSDGLSVA